MALIGAAEATGVTLTATVDGGGGDWAPAAEVYPVWLNWGVELSAPGVFFLDANVVAGRAVFEVGSDGGGSLDAGYASMVGTAMVPINVGMNSTDTLQTDAIGTVQIEAGNTLYIANASVNGSFSVTIGGMQNFDSLGAFYVNPGASLVLGQDQSGGVTGTVQIGNTLGQQATDGYAGIDCIGDVANSVGCTVTDATLAGQSAVVIQGQEGFDLWVEDFCKMTLTSMPVLGVPPSSAGFNQCPSKPDGQTVANFFSAVWTAGAATLSMSNGTVQCIQGTAFSLRAQNGGAPTITIDNTVVQNTDLGIEATSGTATVTNSTFRYNFIGMQQSGSGIIDLSDGGNTVICSSYVESSQDAGAPGIDVLNTSSTNLAADNVAWDTTGPDYFTCDSAYQTCSCNNASCTTSAGGDDMDAVEVAAFLPDGGSAVGGITTTGNTQSANGCN
jgi:hypothetical protein